MIKNLLALLAVGSAILPAAFGHGRLTKPSSRDVIAGLATYLQNAPVAYGPDFGCRGYPAVTPQTTLTAGSPLTVQWTFDANHVGDCFFYLTYDTDLDQSSQNWFKIAEFAYCDLKNKVDQTVTVPSWLPACDHCVLRFEWYALHLVTTPEFYTQCVDVKIVSSASPGYLGTPRVKVPYHLPADNLNGLNYRNAYGGEFFFTGPAVAVADTGSSVTPSTSVTTQAATTSSPATTTASPVTTSAPATTTAAPATTTASPATTTASPSSRSRRPRAVDGAAGIETSAPESTGAAPISTSPMSSRRPRPTRSIAPESTAASSDAPETTYPVGSLRPRPTRSAAPESTIASSDAPETTYPVGSLRPRPTRSVAPESTDDSSDAPQTTNPVGSLRPRPTRSQAPVETDDSTDATDEELTTAPPTRGTRRPRAVDGSIEETTAPAGSARPRPTRSGEDSSDSSTRPPSCGVARTDNRCGPAFGDAVCPEGKCCSRYGFCGTGQVYCGTSGLSYDPASQPNISPIVSALISSVITATVMTVAFAIMLVFKSRSSRRTFHDSEIPLSAI